MARPKIALDLVLRIYDCRRSGLSIDKTLDQLSKQGIQIGRGTVQKYTYAYENLTEEFKADERPVVWHEIEVHGLPAEATKVLLRLWAYALEQQDLPITTMDGWRIPTMRQIKWWWRIYNACPKAPWITILIFANEFIARERLAALGYKEFRSEDIWAHFAFRGWENSRKEHYLQALNGGAIPAWTITSDRDGKLGRLLTKESAQSPIP